MNLKINLNSLTAKPIMFGVGSVFGFMAVRSMRPRAQGFCLGLGVAYLAQKAVK